MRVSICGMGTMGKNHLRVCNKLGLTIHSTYDPIDGSSYNKFLQSLTGASALIIASPTHQHTKNIADALAVNKNLKILCEKPITSNTEDPIFEELLPYENSILVGQIERFNPVVKEIKNIIKTEKNDVVQIKTRRVGNVPARELIDCRKDIGIHDLDICCYLLDSKPSEIFIMNDSMTNQKHHENLFYQINNTQIANEVSWVYPYKDRTIEVLFSNTLVKGHFYHQTLTYTDWTGKHKNVDLIKQEPLVNEIETLYKMVTDNIPSPVLISENYKLLQLLGY